MVWHWSALLWTSMRIILTSVLCFVISVFIIRHYSLAHYNQHCNKQTAWLAIATNSVVGFEEHAMQLNFTIIIIIIIIIIYPITARIAWATQTILPPVFSIFPCSPMPSGTWRTLGLSIPWCCLLTFFSVCLVFFPLSLCFSRWFWPDLMDGRHVHTTAVCLSLRRSLCKTINEVKKHGRRHLRSSS